MERMPHNHRRTDGAPPPQSMSAEFQKIKDRLLISEQLAKDAVQAAMTCNG